MKKIQGLKTLVIILLTALLAVGCSTSEKDTTPNTTPKETELKIAQEAEPTTLDPFNATDVTSSNINRTIFEGLLQLDENLQIVPGLAKEFSYNDDATQLHFILHEGIKFHDGSELTAEVVKANFEFVKDPENNMARSGFFSFINEIEIVNDYELIIHSKAPNASMASYFSHTGAGIKSQLEIQKKLENPDYNLDRNPVGTGPFKFVEWRDGQHILLEKNEEYWNTSKMAQVQNLKFLPVPEAATRVNMLKANEIHFVASLPTGDADELQQNQNIGVISGPSNTQFYVGINFQEEKYQDKNVRYAMNYAINKDQLIAQIVDGYGSIAASSIAPGVYGYSAQSTYEYDVNKAKALMAEAGYAEGFTATLWTRNSTEFIDIADFIAIQLKEIGIDVKIEPYESGTLFDMLDAGDKGTDLWIGRWSVGTGEADQGLRPNFYSDRIPPSYNNSGFYINHTVDSLLDTALATADETQRLALYNEVQKELYTDAPWVFLYTAEAVTAHREEVGGLFMMKDGSVILTQAFFK
ncbi:glutathione ABC transporter substrate-binding protein [Alkalicella caledoniensis]|uniref:Glutathione ABC transporter substrate-binding protein n=1 Tax=Alkalicella caledoniensis TaxID=2731377 RepID=A0A7G9W6W8_ALKCA|nr:glutathione ABC transporter substrate-binding protein [Alkalicella caledoniensis]QNO14430.1 glutathione ABC transporter substrate-binding protein [Alkalicella caledoniensis]